MKAAIRCTWWEMTERMGPWRGNISSPIFRNLDTGEELEQQDLPIGALYAAKHPLRYGRDRPEWLGADGLSIVCVAPGRHFWYIDSRASNCTKPNDDAHRCWVRHGTVGEKLTVDKAGNTCKAGGGSIVVPGYHGFLRQGELVPA